MQDSNISWLKIVNISVEIVIHMLEYATILKRHVSDLFYVFLLLFKKYFIRNA